MSDSIRPFTIAVPDSVLTDLYQRLRNTRWPDAEVVDDWSQGIPLAYVREVARYWADDYDWRAREAALNRFDQFVTEIDGIDVHFIHQRSPHADAQPLLLTHGWPGSIVEFHKVIEPLTEPTRFGGAVDDAFHVIAPSLPGYGFSGKPTTPGVGVERIASMWADLMSRLGYDRYFAQGGDWGSSITTQIGTTDADHCAAIHITLATHAGPRGKVDEPDERRSLERSLLFRQSGTGYSSQQKTRPQTLGYGLHDSPTAQLAWILEKFHAWTDCASPTGDRHPENVLTRDEMLDNVMLYWATGSATSSARLYWESYDGARRQPVMIPTGFGVYPEEIVPPVRSWVEDLYPNIHYWCEHERGGHFAAFEVPDTFVTDLRDCFRPLRPDDA